MNATRITAIVLAIFIASPAGAVDFVGRRSKLQTSLVPAYTACTEPTLTHAAPLSFPACPASRLSEDLAFGGRGWGQVRMTPRIIFGHASDVQLDVDLYDVRAVDGAGTPFDGLLVASALTRSTDRYCPGAPICSMIDLPGLLPFIVAPLPCGASAVPPLPAGRCHASVSANALLGGAVNPGKGANIEIGQIQIYHGENVIFVQGMFLP